MLRAAAAQVGGHLPRESSLCTLSGLCGCRSDADGYLERAMMFTQGPVSVASTLFQRT